MLQIKHTIEDNLLSMTMSKWGRDDAILALNRIIRNQKAQISAKDIEIGMMKSEIAELQYKLKQERSVAFKGKQKVEVHELKKHILNLEYQLAANNLPVPKIK